MISALPPNSLLSRYQDGHYTDCFSVVVPGSIPHQQLVQAFYKTRLFKSERFILKWLAKKPSTDADVDRLAAGGAGAFAAWTVEDRAENQLLLCDFRGTTRSWLMVDPSAESTRLFFGSAVIKNIEQADGTSKMGESFKILLGLHKLYSKALLRAATKSLRKMK